MLMNNSRLKKSLKRADFLLGSLVLSACSFEKAVLGAAYANNRNMGSLTLQNLILGFSEFSSSFI
jgi:hypothetical protein